MNRTNVLLLLAAVVCFDSLSVFCKATRKKKYDPAEEKEIPVKIKLLGDLATPHPDSGVHLGFVPKQVYYQVRRYDTKKRLPQSEAVKDASTPEEVENAPRLREVLTHKKTQEVYEEQGYEDAGYDHGGAARHKEENERLLENDDIEFDKDSAPNHFDDDQGVQEDSEQPSRENRESDAHSDTLSQMNSNTRHKKIKLEKNDNNQRDNRYDTGKGGTRRRGHNKVAYSSDRSEKQSRKHHVEGNMNRRSDKERNKILTLKKGARDSSEASANRRIGNNRQKNQKHDEVRVFNFDVEKYPFYNKLNSNKYTKHSALKYALNPKEIPVKVPNQMSFYNSRKLHCDEVTGPQVEVPKGEEKNPDNSELKNPNRGKPRMGKLGESIDCLKRKFFGHDPLDNPFFKETIES